MSARDSENVQSRLPWIDSLRGIAAIWVVLFHLNTVERFSSTPYQSLVDMGWLGVIMFFVVSGFSIQLATHRVESIGAFAWHRLCRIYPPYLASLVMIVGLIFVRKLCFGTNDFIPLPRGFGGWGANVFVATRPVTDYPAVNWVYWSLGYEIAFYLVLSASVALKPLKWPVLIGVTLAACVLGGRPPHVVFFLRYWSFFALGAALAEWRTKQGFLPIVLLGFCAVDFIRNQSVAMVLAGTLTAVSCWGCMITAGAWLNRDVVFRWAGQWSYSLYLIHVPIGCWIGLRIIASIFGQGVRQEGFAIHLIVDCACLIASCVAAVIFWRIIERPSIAMMHSKMTWSSARPALTVFRRET